ncbi:hypothetical protein FNAPI_4496 [Fusarium napiforme]|uniref:Ubiquitin-like domain-containing protein n=1 Tax=Fusarium napiforme TaxID=42672 RepID=A0A8H5JSJ8_9HYPO|nr:hypothetical protein FNAPI_4496 [Fusarium napiforme]
MDPLSIMASIAGIATAGTSLSKAIYHFISSTRGASREMADIARSISDLSCILSELRRVLQESADICSRKLLCRIRSATRRISKIHDDIYGLMENIRGFQNFRWSFKRSEVQYKLTLIESHKTAIQLMLNILILAATTRKEAQSQVTQPASASEGKQEEPESEIPLLRQQSENLAYAASHCMVDLSDNESFETSQSSSQPKTDSDSENEDVTRQVQVHGHGSSAGTGRWLFELIFENSYKHGEDSETQEQDGGKGREYPAFDTTALVVRTPAELQIAIYEPGAGQLLIDRLLADWTCLSYEEVTGTLVRKPETEDVRPSSPPSAQHNAVIRFKDAVGRRYGFPYHLVQTLEGIENMIKEAFRQVDGLYPYVLARRYDLIDSDGNSIDLVNWESTVEPGLQLEMTMWPLNNTDNPTPNLKGKRAKALAKRREKLESEKAKVTERVREDLGWKRKKEVSLLALLTGHPRYKFHD